MPLAIVQAGAYIFTRGIGLTQYLLEYKENFKQLARKKPRSGWQYGEHTIFTTWEISFKAIENENPKAADILLLSSFMSNEDIKEEIFPPDDDSNGMVIILLLNEWSADTSTCRRP